MEASEERYACIAEAELLTKIYYQPSLWNSIEDLIASNFSAKFRPVFEAYKAVWSSNNALSPGLLSAYWGDPPREILIRSFVEKYVDSNSVVQSVSAIGVASLVEVIKAKNMQRELLDLGARLLKIAPNCSKETAEMLCANTLGVVRGMTVPSEASSYVVNDVLNTINEEYAQLYLAPNQLRGISWGYSSLDEITDGLVPGEVTVIAARPSVGKTTFALNIVLSHHYPALIFSLEMSASQLTRRLVDAQLGYSVAPYIRSGRKITLKGHPQFSAWKDWPLIIDTKSSPTPEYIYFKAAQAVQDFKVEVVVVDYLQLVAPSTSSRGALTRDREIAAVMSALKSVARDFHVPVIALSQLNRGFESREVASQNKTAKPVLSDLRDSGSIEQDADVVVFLLKAGEDGLSVLVRKNRNGPLGEVMLAYDHAASRITKLGTLAAPSRFLK